MIETKFIFDQNEISAFTPSQTDRLENRWKFPFLPLYIYVHIHDIDHHQINQSFIQYSNSVTSKLFLDQKKNIILLIVKMEMDLGNNMVLKVGLFVVVQALVYIILSQSSNVFSKTPRSHSFKSVRSLSIRHWAAALADIPAGGEQPSPPKKPLI